MDESQANIGASNHGYVAGRDLIVQGQNVTSWVKQRKAIDDAIHHFHMFFSLIESINDKTKRVANAIDDCKKRMKREFNIDQISELEARHQKEIYEMRNQLMKMKHASECTTELIETFRSKLDEISCAY